MSDWEETIWDPISSLGRVMPPSDFVLDSSRSSFSQTKKNWPQRLLPRPSTPQTLTHYVKFIFLRTSPLRPAGGVNHPDSVLAKVGKLPAKRALRWLGGSILFLVLSDLNQAVPNKIRYRLVQVRQNQKKTFRVGGPQSPFSISSSFILSFVLLPFFLNTKRQYS